MYTKVIPIAIIFILMGILSYSVDAFGITNNSNAFYNSNQSKFSIFGCEKYDLTFHCDPFKNAYEGFDISSNSTVVANITRTPIYVEGVSGQAVLLNDKYSEYIHIPRIQAYETPNFSISFWIKDSNGNPQFAALGHIITLENRENKNGWSFTANNNENRTLEFKLSNSEGHSAISNEIPFSDNSFTHVVATFDGSFINMYRNGDLFERINYTGNYEPEHELPIHIGSDSSCDSCQQFKGILDDLRFYDKALTTDQIKTLYMSEFDSNSSKDDSSSDNSLVGHWTFDSTLSDKSKYMNSAQMFTPLTSIAKAPDGRMFISEKNTGDVLVMINESLLEKPLIHINDSYVDWEQGLLGLAIDPNFENNHYVYLYYTAHNLDGIPYNKVIKFVEKNNSASQVSTILDKIPASHGYHSGGAMSFGPDGKLYIVVGDATEHIYAQSLAVLIGKVLRINTDGSYPTDNPFPNSPIYTLGHRNMFGIGFSFKDGIGIVTENGDAVYDEVNILVKGGNYGFPTLQEPNIAPLLSNSTLDIKPIRSFWKTIGPTQIIFYEGDKFPSMSNKFLFGTFTGDIYSISIDNKTKTITSEAHNQINHFPYEPVIGISQTDGGDIYYGSYHLYKINSIMDENKKQILFPISVQHSTDTTIDGMQVGKQGYLFLDLHRNTKKQGIFTQDENLRIQIPKDLISNVSSVNATTPTDHQQKISYNVTSLILDTNSTNNLVSITLPNLAEKTRIAIYSDPDSNDQNSD